MIVDCHVHINPFWLAKDRAIDVFRNLQPKFSAAESMAENPELFVEYLDEQGVDGACSVHYVSEDIVGYPEEVNEYAAEFKDAEPERLRAIAGVGLDQGATHVHDQLDRIIEDLGLDGVKIHPPHQDIAPNAYRGHPVGSGHEALAAVYERCSESDLPVMIHTGTSFFPGARNVHADPMHVDDVCIDYACDVIMCHGGRPIYYDEAFFLYRRHDNIFFDISSIPPSQLMSAFPKLESIADKTLFGSDWPAPLIPDISENIRSVRELPLSTEAIDGILGENAAALFDF